MTDRTRNDEALDQWLTVINRRNRRRRLVESTIKGDAAGFANVPLRFVLKIAEVGPMRAGKMAATVVSQRLRAR
ncbi:hypothetical protein [Glaciihabitans sp. dw_435]|uniref:hypothetical protein n=1 Tax=Glaciihabitans sp. dw_435 TaxID=2720081 RepID=UPI001BD49AB0|nr:hypothetical protein [Glaciihabitans sp. dw_435]